MKEKEPESVKVTTQITVAYKYLASVKEAILAMPALGLEFIGYKLNGINNTCKVSVSYRSTDDPFIVGFSVGYLARAEDVVGTLKMIEEQYAHK